MHRKLVKQGVNALTVTLPYRWIKENSLQAGNDVEIDTDGQLLIIRATEESEKEISINLTKKDKYKIMSFLSYAYITGYSKINLILKEKLSMSYINEIVSVYTGLEVVEKNKEKVVIQSFFTGDAKQIEKLIIKMFQLNKTLLKEIKNSDLKMKEVEAYFDFISKLRTSCLRMIVTFNYQKERSIFYNDLVFSLHRLSKSIYYYCNYICTNKIKKRDLVDDIVKLHENLYQAYLKKDPSFTNEIWKDINKYIQNNIGFSKKQSINLFESHIILRINDIKNILIKLHVTN